MKKGIIFLLKILILVLITVWVVIVCIDYFRTKDEKAPKFCLYETTHNYQDGITYECVGFGYKVYKYKRLSITATEFGPVFIKERQNSNGLVK